MNVTKSLVNSFAFMGLLAVLFFSTQAQAQTFATQEGFPVEISLRADQETVMLNEPAYIYLEIKNLSPYKLCVSEGGDYRNALGRPDSFQVKVVKTDGTAVSQPKAWMSYGGFMGCAPIPAGAVHRTALFLPHWATFESTGSYDITVSKALQVTNQETETQNTFAASAKLRINITPIDQVKMSKLVDSLGNRVLGAQYPGYVQALAQLSYLKTPQSFEYLATALNKFANATPNSNEEQICRIVLSTLLDDDDDAAVSLLKNHLHSLNKEVRLEIARALSRSHHPQAANLLSQMASDSYWSVRLSVVYGLGKKKPEEWQEILEALASDQNKEVKAAAQAILDQFD